jgi:DNA-binding CsgD family transcriptional regulator
MMWPTDTLEAMEEIYAAALEPEKWPEALGTLARVSGAEGGIVSPVLPADAGHVVFSPSLSEPVRDYEREWWRHDRRAAESRTRQLTSGLWTDADLVSEEDRARDPFYQEFLRPHGFGEFMARLATPVPGHVVSLNVHRRLRDGAFTREDRERFALLSRHAATALTATVKVLEAGQVARSMGERLEYLGCGVLTLDGAGRVTSVTEAARKLLDANLSIRHGRLTAARPKDQRALDGLIDSVIAGEVMPDPGVAISDPQERTPALFIQALPLTTGICDRLEQVVLRPGALLLLHDLRPQESNRLAMVLKQMGLTAAQARVAEAVGRGLTPKEAALELSLSEATVRTVLKSVYEKLGIGRQSQLAGLVTRLGRLSP